MKLAVPPRRKWDVTTKEGWRSFVQAPHVLPPPQITWEEYGALDASDRRRFNRWRSIWHASLGPYMTDAASALFDDFDEFIEGNQQPGDRIRPAMALDALPGTGKTTAVQTYGRQFTQQELTDYGDRTEEGHQRHPVAYIQLPDHATKKDVNERLCRFYAMPTEVVKGSANELGTHAAEAMKACETQLVIIDDFHFIKPSRSDGRALIDHFKGLASQMPVTFLYVGVNLEKSGIWHEGNDVGGPLSQQMGRRVTSFPIAPFEIHSEEGREGWRNLLAALEEELNLFAKHPGMLHDDLFTYTFVRTTGHFASLANLIIRGCVRAINRGGETLTEDLLNYVHIDAASERAREELGHLLLHDRLSA